MEEFKHIPVMLNEVIDGLDIKENGIYVDCTIGGGGHSREILKRLKAGHLYGFDRDGKAIETCTERFKDNKNLTLIHANYKDAPEILQARGVTKIDGFLIDLGVSSYQIDTAERGFSFLHNGRLDMRMDRSQPIDAYQVVNYCSKEKLLDILYKFGEESNAKKNS